MEIVKGKTETENLTLEEAKTLECFAGLTDQEIAELLSTMKALSEVAFTLIAKETEQSSDQNLKIAA